MLRAYLSNNQSEAGSTKPVVVRTASLAGARGKTLEKTRKQSKAITGLAGT